MDVLIIILAFLVRLLPRIFKPNKIESDTWYHLSSVYSIKNNALKIPKCNDGYILGGKYDYPYMSHWIIASIFGHKTLQYERYIGPVTDTIYILVAYVYFNWFLNTIQVETSINLGLLFLLLMTFSPSMLKVSTGPRVYSFTPRLMGELLIFLYFATMHVFLVDNNFTYLFLSILFGAMALNTSTFGSQVLLLFSVFLSILFGQLDSLLIFFGSFITAFIVSKGHYKSILQKQLNYSFKYASYGQFNHPALLKKNKYSQYIKFFKFLFQLKIKEAYQIFQADLIYLNVFYKNFDVCIAMLYLFLTDFSHAFLNDIMYAGLIIFIITSIKPFLFLGEADRYFDYLVVFTNIFIVLVVPENFLYIILFLNILFYLFSLFLILRSKERYGTNYREAMQFIKKNITDKDNCVIHGILGSYINYSLYLLTGIKALAIEANYVYDLAQNKKLMKKDTVYTNDFKYLFEEYGVNIIVANKKYLKQDQEYDFSLFNKIFENSDYLVYRRL